MGRKKKEAVPMSLTDIDGTDPSAGGPPSVQLPPPLPRKPKPRKPGPTEPLPPVKGKALPLQLDATTLSHVDAIGKRLDRSRAWVARQLLAVTAAKLVTAGDDFLKEAETLKLR